MKRRPLLGLLAPLAWGWLAPQAARGETLHAGLRARLGPPSAPHAMPGGDALRSRRTHSELGTIPRVEHRLRVALGIGRGLVTREDGGFFVLHPSARASGFDAQGKLLYSLKLQAEPASPPVVTSAGAVAFLVAGELVSVDQRGQLLLRTPLGDSELAVRSILSTRDGGVALASSGSFIKLSALRELQFRKAAPEAPLELLETPLGLLGVSSAGTIYRLDAAGRLHQLGELGAAASAVTASADGRLLLARTGSHRLVSFDLQERRPRTSIEDPTLELDGPVLLSHDGIAQAFTADGLLVRYRPDGSEVQRIPIDPGARKAPGPDDAVLLRDGRLLLARVGADAALVAPSGEVTFIPGSACPDPLGLYAAGPRAVLLACRSGTVLRFA